MEFVVEVCIVFLVLGVGFISIEVFSKDYLGKVLVLVRKLIVFIGKFIDKFFIEKFLKYTGKKRKVLFGFNIVILEFLIFY